MKRFIEEMIEAQNLSRAYPDEEKSIEELIIDELEQVIELFEEAGNNVHDIKQYIYERIEKLKKY